MLYSLALAIGYTFLVLCAVVVLALMVTTTVFLLWASTYKFKSWSLSPEDRREFLTWYRSRKSP